MRKRIGLVVLFLIGVLLITLGATSVFAQEPVVSGGEVSEETHQACVNGDYQAMAELHAQYHGGEGATTGGMMGNSLTDNVTAEMMSGCGGVGGMMGGGSGGMMGSGSGGMMSGGSGGMMGNGSGGMMGNW